MERTITPTNLVLIYSIKQCTINPIKLCYSRSSNCPTNINSNFTRYNNYYPHKNNIYYSKSRSIIKCTKYFPSYINNKPFNLYPSSSYNNHSIINPIIINPNKHFTNKCSSLNCCCSNSCYFNPKYK
jgi:hypothetical protein